MARSFFLLALLWTVVLGAVVPSTHYVHEKREHLHQRWTKRDRVPSHKVLPVRIGLTQNIENAEDHLMAVSDPSSPKYAKYWSPEEVIDHFKPSDEAVTAVHEWLTSSGIHADRITHSDNKAWLAFHATNAETEALLHTEFYEFHDSETGGKIPSCDQYHLPKHLQDHIDYVTPGIKLVAMKSGKGELKRRTVGMTKSPGSNMQLLSHQPEESGTSASPNSSLPPNLRNCDTTITPDCVAALYQIPPTDKNAKPCANNSMGIFESEAEYYAQQDLNLFYKNFTHYIPQGTHPKVLSIDGAPTNTNKNLSNSGGEVMLDLELSYPIVYPQTITVFQDDDAVYELWANDTYSFGFNTWLDAIDGSYCTFSAYGETGDSSIDPQYPDPRPGGYKGKLQCGVYQTTNVISLSYGGQEADLPASYQRRQCLEYLKLGMQGVSIFFASGDAGVGNYPAPYGFDNPQTGCLGPKGRLFNPTWPSNCPYVTSVGATKVYPGKTVYEPESAVFDPVGHPYAVNFSSGGGFSNLYAPAKYQQKAIADYFAANNPPYPSYSKIVNSTSQIPGLEKLGLYNRIGRGQPDVAANGDNTATYVAGAFGLSGGTSAATPIFASIVNRINEERIKKGKKPVGFVNPALYANPHVLNDITNGTNPGCWTVGFKAVKGWDPVSGLGTPNYPRMLDLFMGLP